MTKWICFSLTNALFLYVLNQPIPSEKSLLSIRNILGEMLITKTIDKSDALIDVSMLPNGIYFVEITPTNKQAESRKLLKIM